MMASVARGRQYVYAASVRGRWQKVHRWSGVALQVILFATPWLMIGGYPAILIDLPHRRLFAFGHIFGATDTIFLVLIGLFLAFSLFFVTAVLGRLWCGFLCPQTVFLEEWVRRIEIWIEGERGQRRARDQGPLTFDKAWRKALKWSAFLLLAFVVSMTLVSYFAPARELWSGQGGTVAYGFVLAFTGALYWDFAWFREQLCIVICPYGRLQSALIDDHSLIVGYDTRRGEPRGKLGSGNTGDCVDCNRCVHVCPTGIDIRQGLQMECIGCTACIDACNDVMRRIHKPPGLIRYDSQAALAGGRTQWIRPRTILYGLLLLIGISVASWAVSTLKPANASITRITGAPYIVTEDAVRNQFLIRLINKRAEPVDFTVRVDSPVPVHQTGLLDPVAIGGMAEEVRPLVLVVPRTNYTGPFAFTVTVSDTQNQFTITREVEFLGPDARLLQEDSP